MDTELHLPWDNEALQSLLMKVIQTGETTKVDFKRQLNIAEAEHHAELMKDISALANTYDSSYRNHGFIILGVTGNTLTHTSFPQNADGLQARIDQLLNTYIEPFVPTQVRIFGNGSHTWGVIIVPPTRTAPHVFVKDIHKRCRGEIFVRRGTTTDKAAPFDYVRFFRLHLDEYTYELREQLEDLKRQLVSIKRRPLGEQVEEKTNSLVARNGQETNGSIILHKTELDTPFDLLDAIDNKFAAEDDPIVRGLFEETQKIQRFLSSEIIPWNLNHVNQEIGKRSLDEIEKVATSFWVALGTLAYRDDKGEYDQAITRTISCLAQKQDAPLNLSYTEWGLNIRYLPLVVSLYILFITAASKRRYLLLKKLLELHLSCRSPYEEPEGLPSVLFKLRRAAQVFQTQHPGYPRQTWCDAVGSVIESILQRVLNIEGPLWNRREAFFVGEFILCLTPLDIVDRDTKNPLIGHPASGLYLYFSEANPIIKRFLRTESKSLAQVFKQPFANILSAFDKNAAKLVQAYWGGHGFVAGALGEAFPELVNQAEAANLEK